MARLYNTISTHSYHPNLKHIIELFVQEFDICQIIKLPVSGSGCLPPAVFYSLHSFKWQWILLDHGLSSSTHKTFLFKGSHVLTMSPIQIRLFAFLKLLHTLACYLKTIGWHLFLTHLDVFYDDERKDGRVFIGTLLLYILKVNGIKVVTTIKYPQAITICERIHQAISTNL